MTLIQINYRSSLQCISGWGTKAKLDNHYPAVRTVVTLDGRKPSVSGEDRLGRQNLS